MNNQCVLALGFFDGIHLGHRALLDACLELAHQHGAKPGVVTFENHPDGQVMGNAPGLINTLPDRKRLMTHFGMEQVIALPFDRALRSCPWQDFVRMLMEKYQAVGFVCGEDYRFGDRGMGNAEILRQYCADNGMPCTVVPQLRLDGVVVSSTHIRHLMETGHMSQAVRFLGHPHIFTGKVVHGNQLSSFPGASVANLMLPRELIVPMFGAYACVAVVDGVRYPAVTNIGTRPSAAGIGITVEPWVLDYEGDLQGREITLEFYQFLRPEQKFSTVETLQQEISENAAIVREILKVHC